MTQYAYFDSTQEAPQPVLGWYDTGVFDYSSLPATNDLLVLTSTQWTNRLSGSFAVSGGALVAYTPPSPTLTTAQQAAAAIAPGLTITSTGTPAINGTYAIDGPTQSKIAAVEVYILKNSTFPGGVTSYPWPTLTGGVTFPNTAVFQTWATAIADHVSALDIIIAQDSGTLPSSSVTIA